MKLPFRKAMVAMAVAAGCGVASAGPVIIGGDDLTDHGARVGGVNVEGWLYIEKAVSNILSGVTRAGIINYDIVALGSIANPTFTGGNAGGAIGSAAANLGRTVTYIDGAANITAFFAALAAGSINPNMLWMAGTGAANDLEPDEGAALTANAAAINTFVNSGGGLMSHGFGTTAYGWLSALLPGINEVIACNSTGATLTAAGIAAFPGLSNNDINQNAGPCHSSFTGTFGGLQTLAFDGNQRSFIIGGGAGTVIQCGLQGQPPCPTVPEPGSMLLVATAGLALLGLRRRRQSK